jgi:hypothetical protein
VHYWSACVLYKVGIDLQVGNHELVKFNTFDRLWISLVQPAQYPAHGKETIPDSPWNWRVPNHDNKRQAFMFHDIPECIPLGAHLDFWEEGLYISTA